MSTLSKLKFKRDILYNYIKYNQYYNCAGGVHTKRTNEIKTNLRWQLYLHIRRSSQQLQPGCAGGGVEAPSSGGVRQPGALRGVPQLPWRVPQGVLLALMGRPSLRHLCLGRLESHLPWQQHREEAFPCP